MSSASWPKSPSFLLPRTSPRNSRPASFSRISSLTGIHRHAVSSVKAALEADEFDLLSQKEYQRNRLARVLGGWFEHPDFTDRDGRPRRLPLQGPGPSFTELVRRFSGDIYPGIILDELRRAGAIKVTPDGSLQAISRRVLPAGADGESLERKSYTRESLRADMVTRFGPDTRFYTCSADSMTPDELMSFLEARGKFVPASDGFTTDPSKLCNH